MTSRLSWLDTDPDQNRRMNELVDLFKDKSAVDELGIGTIRDTFANALFPGTSVLHTRARYLLFIAWLLDDVARHGWTPDRAQQELRSREVKLIKALLAGGEGGGRGVIGEQAKDKLKRMPSAAYWAALRRFGLRLHDTSIAGHFRAAAQEGRRHHEREDDEPGRSSLGVDPQIPPPPRDFLSVASFALTEDEARYLRDKIASRCPGSLFADLVLADPLTDDDLANVSFIWEHPHFETFDARHQRLIDHGQRLHHLQYGAALLYNLILAEKTKSDDLVETYEADIERWLDTARSEVCLDGWDFDDFWLCVAENATSVIRSPTRSFVTAWHRILSTGDVTGKAARTLVANRELQLKGPRSRIHNPSARLQWTGGAGLVALSYRWEVAQRYLLDLANAREVADAVA
ncbi:hypothetical protein CLV56_3258 [Mumia flava]|uniref:Uncharacterized protein n=1 Tax=Mumia flava TaxID=1348852 RepID=A0A0B2BSG4_9ACTN|nr:DUF6361 family protein [Mumia flava]PJJ53764.1 hypothetical protein CLV56_3258 [Mumia flava]